MPSTCRAFLRVIRVASTSASLAPMSPSVSASMTLWVA